MNLTRFFPPSKLAILLGGLCLIFFTSVSLADNHEINPDPYEKSNRRVYKFNTGLDNYLLLPLTKGYDYVTPPFIQTGVTNFFSNTGEPYVMLNDALQLKMVSFYAGAARVTINTVIGLFGLIDVATYIGIPRHSEDFGQTLGAWGAQPGPYLEVPFLGPSTSRDLFPTIVETFYAPRLSLLTLNSDQRWALFAINLLNNRNNLRGVESIVIGDRYTFIRDAYLQNREYQVRDGAIIWDSFGSDEFDENLDELDDLDNLESLDGLE